MANIFNTDKRIKLGIWGLGRGQSFVRSAAALNIDVVAGCDIHPHMRETFKKNVPDAFVTDNEDEFLSRDFDAVLIATYFPDHAKHALKALAAGKHVMSEVTSLYTPAQGVELVEAVEKSGKVYNLLENYPFSKDNMFLKKLWGEGFFGEFMYGEFEYVHDCRTLTYAYNVEGGLPIEPGYQVHNWRSVFDVHQYNTHSLGPLMQITGLRPVSVWAPMADVVMPGYLADTTRGRLAPSMVQMSNGGVMRNLMGNCTNDYHSALRIWGTKASAEKIRELKIRIGGCGNGAFLNIASEWPDLGDLASVTGHGGGDFWELYYFARQILTGEPAPWDIYAAADVTITGILAARSRRNGGVTYKIPDFRQKSDRDLFRNDDELLPTIDPLHIFPDGHDPKITGNFCPVMAKLFPMTSDGGVFTFRKAIEGMRIYPFVADAEGKMAIVHAVNKALQDLPQLASLCEQAAAIMNAYPDSTAGRTIKQALTFVEMDKLRNIEATSQGFRDWLAKI
ncbi:MAG: Gfo/Idh/MocA family oxidoreductase [Victivallales bacterium]|nr:Gfo/Idh/MocA family oxidoreductase [Victivallales bacterium]